MTDTIDSRGDKADYVYIPDPEPATGDNVTGADGQLAMAIPAAKYAAGKTATASDTNLVAGNIKNAIAIFGVTGTLISGAGVPTAAYPTASNDTYVKATSNLGANFRHYFATDMTKLITGSQSLNSWISNTGTIQNRFHIDLGLAKIIKFIYFENFHNSGASVNIGVKNYTFWGSNTAAAFADLTYANDANWIQLTTDPTAVPEHPAVDEANPIYAIVTNTTQYRYYAFKFSDNWGDPTNCGLRRIIICT